MRKEPTKVEALLWNRLLKRQLGGLKFRRQHIIHHIIVDIYCPSMKLAIEIDGPVRDVQAELDIQCENGKIHNLDNHANEQYSLEVKF